MRKIILFFIITATLSLHGQEITKIDSLLTKLDSTANQNQKFEILEKIIYISFNKSQKVDSLSKFYIEYIRIAKKKNEYQKLIKCYLYLSENFLKERQKEDAFFYIDSATQVNNILRSDKQKILIINQKGRIFEAFEEYQKAINVFKDIYSIEDIYSKCGATPCNVISNIGVAEKKLGNALKSIEYHLEALECLELNPNPQIYNFVINNIGWAYMDIEQYDKAEEYFLKALTSMEANENERSAANIYRSIAINYSRWGKYEEALNYNKKALDIYLKQGRKLLIYDVTENIAITYARMENFSKAESYSSNALKIAKEINFELGIKGSKLTLAQTLISAKKFLEAEKYLLDISKDTSNTRFRQVLMEAYLQSSSILYEKTGNYRESLKFQQRFKSFSDSIVSEGKEKEITEIERKYNIEKKEKELAIEREEKQELLYRNSELNWYLAVTIAGIVLSILIILLFYRSYKLKREAEIQKKSKKILSLENKIFTLISVQKETKLQTKISFDEHLKETYNITNKMLAFWKLQAQGYVEREIAEILGLKESGIETRRNSLYTKFFQKEKKKFNRNTSIGLYLNEITQFYEEKIHQINTSIKDNT
ncbi:hypothetical protein IMCC3317_41030 [Kordia antarctica]|uniref:Photosystem I assembly protein Ycf3 n=1 Tax=Kordia antarctica TaxID=1218801 RepID=A0A7L4ZQF7_9FLAO|nr:tetratricopeptide repeat protein [Kordia antarctica]QHI38709.1 hypothetical protein IMCC3317_41030 [Kordia antarctica]